MLFTGGFRMARGAELVVEVADQRRRLEIVDQAEQVGLVRKADHLQILVRQYLADVVVLWTE